MCGACMGIHACPCVCHLRVCVHVRALVLVCACARAGVGVCMCASRHSHMCDVSHDSETCVLKLSNMVLNNLLKCYYVTCFRHDLAFTYFVLNSLCFLFCYYVTVTTIIHLSHFE